MISAISYAIMHVPGVGRDGYVKAMLKRLPKDRVSVIVDNERSGIWPTARRAWFATRHDCDRHMVLQDDFTLCDDFDGILGRFCEGRKRTAVSAFMPSCDNVNELYKSNQPIETPETAVLWGGTICLPSNIIKDMIDWCDKYTSFCKDADDQRITRYLRSHGFPMIHTQKELMRHDGYDKSLVNHHKGDWRKGAAYIGDMST
jgi:hypothetical protein